MQEECVLKFRCGPAVNEVMRERTAPRADRVLNSSKGDAVKINGGGSVKPTSPASAQEVTAGKQTSPQAPAAPSSARGDKVEITSTSAQLQQLEKLLSDVGVVDVAHV